MKKGSVYIVGAIFLLAVLASVFDIAGYWPFADQILPKFFQRPFLLGLDLQGGTHLLYQADLSRIGPSDAPDAMQGVRDVIERRVNLFGVQEPVVQTEQAGDKWRLVVELAGIRDVKKAIEMIGRTPLLEFRELASRDEIDKILQDSGATNQENLPVGSYFKPTQLTGQYLKGARVEFDQTSYQPYISLEFNDEGAKIFESITSSNVGRPLAIYIDDVLISNPVVQEKISGGKAQITGDFSVPEAKELARNLNAGALPVPINLISQQTVGPSLGAISLQQSLKAGFIAFVFVVIYVIFFYRLPGFVASLALIVYAVILLALLKLIPVTLTLSGIGGAILSIGMAVDANVLIFSRMREELQSGKNFTQSLTEGFNRAWPSIRDGNLTTFLVALILFYFGTSFVKGFALTLSLGIVVHLFSAIFVTRYLLYLFERTRFENWGWLWR